LKSITVKQFNNNLPLGFELKTNHPNILLFVLANLQMKSRQQQQKSHSFLCQKLIIRQDLASLSRTRSFKTCAREPNQRVGERPRDRESYSHSLLFLLSLSLPLSFFKLLSGVFCRRWAPVTFCRLQRHCSGACLFLFFLNNLFFFGIFNSSYYESNFIKRAARRHAKT